ncbi:protein neprosin-like [Bidens hawaiensis]|uniref:protein neprosin-like n=1 Tax=Bidens hawaiensis TaxID=980011 RepID=UPI00404A90FA
MRSSYCHEIIPSLISVLVCSFFLFSPIYVVKGIGNLWQENESSMSGDEYKKMKLINASLRKINKPFVKSIKSPDGDIIDCVLIHLQPAFDLPELRGTMPLGPPKLPKGHDNKTITSEIKQLWSSNGESCPNGTIPIRRTSASDILRFRPISKFGKKISPTNDSSGSRHEHALGCLLGKKYHGIKAIVNVWAPKIANKDDYSNAQIWVISNIPNHDVNVIEAGWMITNSQSNTVLSSVVEISKC